MCRMIKNIFLKKIVAFCAVLLGATSCELINPEVVVQNQLDTPVQIRDLSFNGCKWSVVLAYGESTSVCNCMPGSDRLHFKKFDAQSYFNKILEEIESGEHEYEPTNDRIGVKLPTPLWFNYRTKTIIDVEYGSFNLIEILPNDIEQDFDTPGPYGH